MKTERTYRGLNSRKRKNNDENRKNVQRFKFKNKHN